MPQYTLGVVSLAVVKRSTTRAFQLLWKYLMIFLLHRMLSMNQLLWPAVFIPSIPHIFGLNVTQKPYFLVSYFYGIRSSSCTLYRALYSKSLSLTTHCLGKILLKLCQALHYLHSKQLLHRDIKSDNILLTEFNSEYHPMLIDFGKSIQISEAPSKRKSLTLLEQNEYRKKHRHIAPEVVLGHPPSFLSDIFSFGVVMSDVSHRVKTESCFLDAQKKCLEKDPKLRCPMSYLLSQLESNVAIYQK